MSSVTSQAQNGVMDRACPIASSGPWAVRGNASRRLCAVPVHSGRVGSGCCVPVRCGTPVGCAHFAGCGHGGERRSAGASEHCRSGFSRVTEGPHSVACLLARAVLLIADCRVPSTGTSVAHYRAGRALRGGTTGHGRQSVRRRCGAGGNSSCAPTSASWASHACRTSSKPVGRPRRFKGMAVCRLPAGHPALVLHGDGCLACVDERVVGHAVGDTTVPEVLKALRGAQELDDFDGRIGKPRCGRDGSAGSSAPRSGSAELRRSSHR